jgi:hypothetical protein
MNIQYTQVERAQRNMAGIETTKIVGTVAISSAALLGSAPIAAALVPTALLGYGVAVMCDFMLTGRVCPLPGCRSTLGDLLGMFGAIKGGDLSPEGQQFLLKEHWLSTYQSRHGIGRNILTGTTEENKQALRQIYEEEEYEIPRINHSQEQQVKPVQRTIQPEPVQRIEQPKTKLEPKPDPWGDETVEAIGKMFKTETTVLEKALTKTTQLQEERQRSNDQRVRPLNLVTDIATASGEESPKSLIFLGPSRSGKSWAMAASLAEAKKYWEGKGKNVGVWWLSGKDSEKEDNYCKKRGYTVSQYQLDQMDETDLDDVWDEWRGLLMEYARTKEYDVRFFVFDEMNLAHRFARSPKGIAFWNVLIDQAISASSNGRGDGKAMWLATQMGNISSLGLNRGECGVFHDHVVFLKPSDANSQFAEAALRNAFVSTKLDVTKVSAGDTGRFFHYQGRWNGLPIIAMPEQSEA